MKKMNLFLILCFFSIAAFADVTTWQIVPEKSSLLFTATQNNAPVTGEFKKFSGEIYFDPNQLNESHIKIIVDVASVYDPYNQLADTLKGTDWFNTSLFPQAIYQANHFTKIGDNTYKADGSLTIKDKTQAVTITFKQETYTPTDARMSGDATIERLSFGVGQGEWAGTSAVKDEVQVHFVVTAIKKQ